MTALRAAVPLYLHPAYHPDIWTAVLAPGAADLVVVNLDSGPGQRPDPAFTGALGPTSPTVLGYVDTDYGRRPVDAVRAEARLWARRHGVTSVFLDQVVSGTGVNGRVDAGALATLTGLVAALRGDGVQRIVGNPGTVPHPWVLRQLDVTCVRETDLETHLSTPSPPIPDVAASSVWHLVYDCPPDRADEALARSADLGAGLVGLSPDGLPHPWGSVGYLNSGGVGTGD